MGKRVAAAATGVVGLVGLNAAPVAAREPGALTKDTSTEERVSLVKADELKRHTIPATAAKGDTQVFLRDHLDREARSGRPTDVRSVNVIDVDLPDGGSYRSVVDADRSVDEVVVVAQSTADGTSGDTFLGAKVTDAATGAALPKGGIGYDAATTSAPGTRDSYDCTPHYFNPSYNSQNNVDHYVYDCWEKFKSSGSDWAYNRYTLFDPAAGGTGIRGEIIDATIRTRPWAGTAAQVTGGPFDWEPRPSSSCGTGTAGISYGPASLSIPVTFCNSGISVFPNDKKMGTDWNGRTTGQVAIDYAFSITTANVEPTYADYFWMEVQYCYTVTGPCWAGNPSQYLTWTDSGW